MARKTVLVCDSCGREVDEAQGRLAAGHVFRRPARLEGRRPVRRVRREDARPRRGPPRAVGRRRRRRPSCERETRRGRPGTRPAAALRWEGGTLPARRACARGQSRASARALSGAPRRRTRPDRAEPVGRRPGRARPARPLRLPPRRHDRHLRRPVRTARGRRSAVAAGRGRGRALARRATGARGRLRSNGLGRLGAHGRLLGLAPERRSASWSPACSTPATSTASSAVLYAAYRAELERLGLWDRDTERRRAVERLQNDLARLERRAGLRVRLRGSDRRGVDAARGPRPAAPRSSSRSRTSPGALAFASLGAHGDRPVRARRRIDPGARAALCRVRPSGAGASRACAVRGVAAAARRARRRRSLLRGRGRPRHAGARRRRVARADSRRHAARADRARRAVARRLARAARDGARGARRALRGRVARAPRRDAVRARAAAASALRLGRRRAPRALRVPALAVLRAGPLVRRLRRGPAARSCDPGRSPRRGGGREAPRGADPAPRRAARRERPRPPGCARCSGR